MELADPSLLKSQCLVDGKWVGEGTRPMANPATGAVLAKTPRFGEAETIGAIEAAQRAFGSWAKRLPKERAQILAWSGSTPARSRASSRRSAG
jgi:succinate-semialdehyde dehydrogenase/glutarate-semialdehyde dehydrogenase